MIYHNDNITMVIYHNITMMIFHNTIMIHHLYTDITMMIPFGDYIEESRVMTTHPHTTKQQILQ